MEAPEAAGGSKRKPSFTEKRPAPQQNATAAPTPANVHRKSRSHFEDQDAMAVPGIQPAITPSTVPREVLEEHQQVQVQPSSRRPSRIEPPEGQADVKPEPYYGVMTFNDAVEPHKVRGPHPMNPEQNEAHSAAPQPQHPHNDPREGVSMLTPAYLRESLYEHGNQDMTRPCVFCGLVPLIAITIALIFFLSKSSQMMAALERTTYTTATAALNTRPSYGRAMYETTTFADKRGTSSGLVPSVTDDGLSYEKELDDAKASNTTAAGGDVEELSAVVV